MPINIKCPECGDKRSVPDEFAGKKLKCKNCSAVFRAAAPLSAPEATRPSKRRHEDHNEAEEKPRSRRRNDEEDEDQVESKSSRRRDRDEEEKPRSRRRGDDEDEDEEKPRRRSRDEEEDDDEDERPRRGKPGSVRGKSKSKPKKKVTVGYIIGVILAFLFLLAALSFVGWRAGLFESKSKDKDRVDDEKEPEYVAPDPRIGAGRKETIGPDGERVAAVERLRLTIDVSDAGANNHKLVVNYQVVSGASLGANDRLVALQDGTLVVLQVRPEVDTADPRRGTLSLMLTDETRRKIKKLWIAMVAASSHNALKDGVRVSNVVAMP